MPPASASGEDDEADPDGLDQAARVALEERAISLILQVEPDLRRTPTHNPGFDLFKDRDGGGLGVRLSAIKFDRLGDTLERIKPTLGGRQGRSGTFTYRARH